MDGFWIGLGLFVLGWMHYDGLKVIANAMKESSHE